MFTWLRSLFAWEFVGELGVWRYEQNRITGARRAYNLSGMHGPKHSQWLAGGAWERQRPWGLGATAPQVVCTHRSSHEPKSGASHDECANGQVLQ